ncbi:MAG: aminoacyl-tRNA hydrolase [Jiangellales bacterium]
MVVGLGNPGPDYAATRHNVGAMVTDLLAERGQARLSLHRRGRADVAEVRLGPLPGTRTVLARPRAFMNTSGGPVAALVDYFGVPLEQVVVVHDELDLPFEGLRLKRGGGDNGHNGLRSVRQALGTGEFLRVRVGIGRPPGRMDPADFVLRPFASQERVHLDLVVDKAADATEALVRTGLERAQNDFNT